MVLEYQKNVLIFLLVSIGLIALPHLNHIPKPVIIFFYLILVWRFVAIWKQNWLPGFVLVFVLTLSGIGILYIQHQGILGRDAGTNLFMTALALKCLEIKKERDIYLVTYLAFIVAASQLLFEQSLGMAAYALLAISLLLTVLVNVNSRAAVTLQALKIAVRIIVQSIPIAVVIFVFFPRVEAPRWLLFNDKNYAKSGLSDYLEPGSISNLGLSDDLVFRAKFSGTIPPPHLRYWRGPVMTHTDGKRWASVKNESLQKKLAAPSGSGTPYQYTILMEPQVKNWVFALDMPMRYSSPLNRTTRYQLVTSDNSEKRAEYKITSYPDYNTGAISQAEYQESTQLPAEPSNRIKLLVKQLHGFEGSPEVFIQQVFNYFRTENFRYTLTPPLLDKDPIDTFLFKTRSGFCSHYASAFVYLMRATHIPARIVTGYQGGSMNNVGGFLEIRQKDAHAWAEVWLENKGWTRFDPTAAVAPERVEWNVDADQLELGGEISFVVNSSDAEWASAWLKQAGLLWGSVEYNWQRWVINYNSMNQSKFLSSFGIDDVQAMVFWLTAIIAVMTALYGVSLFSHFSEPPDKALRFYAKYCKKLAKKGLIRNAGEGAKAFAERAKIRLPEHSAEIDGITTLFIGLRYGKKPMREDLRQLIRLISIFKI
ncbi:MAG: transglutaminase TgpA family protein [Methylosarcina sp.]